MEPLIVRTDNRQGPIQPPFEFRTEHGYSVLTGPNNSGKSSILQLLFLHLFVSSDYGANAICFIPPDRMYVDATLETAGRSLATFNTEFYGLMSGDMNVPYYTYTSPRGVN